MSDAAFELDVEIRRITGNSTFTKDGLRSVSHLGKVAQLRVARLRERRDALLGEEVSA